MHEEELVETALQALGRLTGGKAPAAVEIALGPGIDEHEAEIAWKGLTDGTSFIDTHVTWERAFDRLVCEKQGHRYAGEAMEGCPYCGADGVVLEVAAPIAVGRWVLDTA